LEAWRLALPVVILSSPIQQTECIHSVEDPDSAEEFAHENALRMYEWYKHRGKKTKQVRLQVKDGKPPMIPGDPTPQSSQQNPTQNVFSPLVSLSLLNFLSSTDLSVGFLKADI